MRVPVVIAEMAGTHDGVLDLMLDGIQAAKDADADAFKTWWCSSAERAAARVHAPELVEAYRVGQFPEAWLAILRDRCHALGLEFLCTVDCAEDIATIAPYVDRFKVASWGATDARYIGTLRTYGKPLIVSTGATTEAEWWRGASAIGETRFLHCTSAYPCPIEDANLRAITRYSLDGWSDHTNQVMMGALAVAAGARILEVHFCLPETAADHPDRCVSHEPDALAEYIRLARLAATAMGTGEKRIMPSERENVRHRYV